MRPAAARRVHCEAVAAVAYARALLGSLAKFVTF